MTRNTLLAVALLAATATPAFALDAGPYAKGSTRLSLGLGSNSDGDIAAGAGVGYFVYDGLMAELDASYWFGSDPTQWSISPGARYVVWFLPVVKPYAGVHYRRIFIGDTNVDIVGARGGIFTRLGSAVLGVGLRYDKLLDCDGDSCADWFPEISVGLVF